MKTPPRHRNITLKRLFLDAFQHVRAQSFVTSGFGKRFLPSREYVEIDITYKCNLNCINCNRSCTQAPSNLEMPLSMIKAFLNKSIEENILWKRIRLLGGEPTLHSRIIEITNLLIAYKETYNPSVRLVLCTNFYGKQVRRMIEKIPEIITIKSTLKSSRVNLFRPFNVAPVDTIHNHFSDYTFGCRIVEDCGLGLTPSGYYMCGIAGGIDRIFQFNIGRKKIPDKSDNLSDQMATFCSLCGHFGFQWPTRKIKMSKTWRLAYIRYRQKQKAVQTGHINGMTGDTE